MRADGDRTRILVVDDDENIADVVALFAEFYEPVHASDVTHAWSN
jgi:DNA-binding response OmpR family regulator